MATVDPQSPAARRLRPPSWLDIRLVIGVLMVLVAVLIGARVVASSDKSTKVWALTRNVASGTRLTESDLRQDRIRLYDNGKRYLSISTSPVGHTVNRDLSGGDLLPGSALTDVPATVILPLSVDQDNTPPGLAHGDRIDVYVVPGSADQNTVTTQVLAGVVVQSVAGLGGGGLGAENSKAQLTVAIAPDQENQVVKRLSSGTLYVTQRVGPAAGGAQIADNPPVDPSSPPTADSSPPPTAGPTSAPTGSAPTPSQTR